VYSDNEQWLQIDEATDVSASLRHFAVCVGLVKQDATAWKWAIISIHNALQGAMTCHLSGTANMGCLDKRSIEAWCDWRERDRLGEINWIEGAANEFGIPSRSAASKEDQPPHKYMATPQTLFDRLSKEKLRYEGGCGAVLPITSGQRRSFKILNELRNQFSHFTPMGWSIEVTGLPEIFSDMIEVIRSIAVDPWPFRHLDDVEQCSMRNLIVEIQNMLKTRSC
jgi:hypothetical protein